MSFNSIPIYWLLFVLAFVFNYLGAVFVKNQNPKSPSKLLIDNVLFNSTGISNTTSLF